MPDDPLWYKDAILYEVHARAFYDSNGDGMGDFAGLTQKLDYLRDLGITAVWVLPFCPSPWRDDGYDIADYTGIHPAYGTLKDFHVFLREAHRRGLQVITELVLNHTSDQHVWFQRSRRAARGTRWRNFYVWSDTPGRYADARIIFKDFESSNWTWDPVAKAYYWHRFYSHQPDLNFDSPEVRAAVIQALDFWMNMGVDGFRLDAVPYLYEREGTSCENLPETHAFLKELRGHVDAKFPNRLVLAEANQWPEDAIAYFGAGDECHMAFHFPLMPRLFMATRMEDRYPITDIMQLTPAIPDNCQWALFLRNHDELTLEMVTDEERDYMYRVYAQDRTARINLGIRRRLAPLLGNDRRRIELLNGLLFSLPGTPVIYYGDEIGMGDNFYLGDRNGVRTPMQWSADRNAGFSRSNPQRLYLPIIIDPEYHYESINVETQQNNPHSLLWWMKRLIQQRKSSRALSRGSLEFLHPENRRVLVFVREYDGERVLMAANLSRFAQAAELDLSRYQGFRPVEMFGRTDFPAITERPYLLSLGPHAFYWFSLDRHTSAETLSVSPRSSDLPVLRVASWETVLRGEVRRTVERMLPGLLVQARWYLGRLRRVRATEMADVIPLPGTDAGIVLLRVHYTDGDPDLYTLFYAIARGEKAQDVLRRIPQYTLARLEDREGTPGAIYAGLWEPQFGTWILNAIARRRRARGAKGELVAAHTGAFRSIWGADRPHLEPAPVTGDQNHSALTFGDRFFLKLYRRVEPGRNPDQEVGAFVGAAGYLHAPRVAGSIEYRAPGQDPIVIGVLQNYIVHEANGWQYSMDHLGLFFERALATHTDVPVAPLSPRAKEDPLIAELSGGYLEMMRLLGRRTAEMHAALASRPEDPEFGVEPFTDFYRHSLFHGMIGRAMRGFEELRGRLSGMADDARAEAERVLARSADVQARFQALRETRIPVTRTRIHGDFHLGQVLFTGKDFVIIDFEGDPNRPAGERRIKRSPMRDVASMLRSFHYLAHSALFGQVPGVVPRKEAAASVQGWAEFWSRSVGTAFLNAYLDTAGQATFVPQSPDNLRVLLGAYLLERAFMELGHDLRHRPDWIRIPIHGILEILAWR